MNTATAPKINSTNANYYLFLAIREDDAAKVDEAIAAGADINKVVEKNAERITTNDGSIFSMPGPTLEYKYTPLQYAIMNKASKAFDALLKYDTLDVNYAGESAPPLNLAFTHNKEAANRLLDHPKIDVNKGDSSPSNPYAPYSGNTAVHLGVREGIATMEKLKARGADFTKKDNAGRTALFSHGWKVENVEWLLKQPGISVNDRDKWGRTPLHYAAAGDALDIMQVLIKHGANVNALDAKDMTPLHHTLMYHQEPDVYMRNIKFLCENGAKVNWINREHSRPRTTLDMKTNKGMGKVWDEDDQPVYQYLIAQGAKHFEDLSRAERLVISREMDKERGRVVAPAVDPFAPRGLMERVIDLGSRIGLGR